MNQCLRRRKSIVGMLNLLKQLTYFFHRHVQVEVFPSVVVLNHFIYPQFSLEVPHSLPASMVSIVWFQFLGVLTIYFLIHYLKMTIDEVKRTAQQQVNKALKEQSRSHIVLIFSYIAYGTCEFSFKTLLWFCMPVVHLDVVIEKKTIFFLWIFL